MSHSLGGQATFNMQHGFVEALVRGFRSGFLSDENYHHLSQCDTLEVIKFSPFFSPIDICYYFFILSFFSNEFFLFLLGYEIKPSRI